MKYKEIARRLKALGCEELPREDRHVEDRHPAIGAELGGVLQEITPIFCTAKEVVSHKKQSLPVAL